MRSGREHEAVLGSVGRDRHQAEPSAVVRARHRAEQNGAEPLPDQALVPDVGEQGRQRRRVDAAE
eukprot:8996890-Alexandrium_andersonii.AAC.1